MRSFLPLFVAATLCIPALATPAAAHEPPAELPAEQQPDSPADISAPEAPRYMFGFALDGVRGVELGVFALAVHARYVDDGADGVEPNYGMRASFDQLQTIVATADGSVGWTLGLSALLGANLDGPMWLDARVETGASIGLGGFATLFPVIGVGIEQIGSLGEGPPGGLPFGGYGLVGLKARTGIAPGFGMDFMALYQIRGEAISHLHLGARALIGRGSPFLVGLAWDRFTEASGLSGTVGLAW